MSLRMHWGFVCLVAAEVVGWGAERLLEQGERVLVRLYNPAGVGEKELAEAVEEATWILGKAGVRAEWVRCEPQAARVEGDRCRETADRWALSLGVTAGAPEGMKELALGFTLLRAGSGNHAAVFHGRVRELVKSSPLAARELVLGAAMAHEIGHVLSGSAGHAGRGLMRARWGKEELLRISQRRLLFGKDDGTAMLARVRAARGDQAGSARAGAALRAGL